MDILSRSGWTGPVYDANVCSNKMAAYAKEIITLGRRCGKILLTWDFISTNSPEYRDTLARIHQVMMLAEFYDQYHTVTINNVPIGTYHADGKRPSYFTIRDDILRHAVIHDDGYFTSGRDRWRIALWELMPDYTRKSVDTYGSIKVREYSKDSKKDALIMAEEWVARGVGNE